jgi:hypothetical protein
MGGDFGKLALITRAVGPALSVTLLLGSGARAGVDCPSVQTLICSQSPGQSADQSCVKPGATFVQLSSGWKPASEAPPIPYPSSSRVNFIYLVDANRTKQKYGLLFVGITRYRSISTTAKSVRLSGNLSDNADLSLPDNQVMLETYKRAVTSLGPITAPLYKWEKIPDTDFFFTTVAPDELQKLDFNPTDDSSDLHARLYRFQSGAGLICIPFWVGAQDNFITISGTVIDLYGVPSSSDSPAAQAGRITGEAGSSSVTVGHFSVTLVAAQSK